MGSQLPFDGRRRRQPGRLALSSVVQMDVAVGRTGPLMTNQAPCDMQALSFHDRVRGVRMTGVMQLRTVGCNPGPQFTDVVLDSADAEQSGPCRRGTARDRHGGRTGTPVEPMRGRVARFGAAPAAARSWIACWTPIEASTASTPSGSPWNQLQPALA